MGTQLRLADTYYRLSDEEKKRGESSSIMNQREMVESYCRSHGIIIVREFVDSPEATLTGPASRPCCGT